MSTAEAEVPEAASGAEKPSYPIANAPVGGRKIAPSRRTPKATEALPDSFIDGLSGAEIRSIAHTRGYDFRDGGSGMSREQFKKMQREDERFKDEDWDTLEERFAESMKPQPVGMDAGMPVAYGGTQLPVGSIPDDRTRQQASFGDGTQDSHSQVPPTVPAEEIVGDASSTRADLETSDASTGGSTESDEG